MTQGIAGLEPKTAIAPTRRDALKLAGGMTLAAFAVGGTRRDTAAQEASPSATPSAGDGLVGKFVVVRVRELTPEARADELIALVRDGFVPLIEEIPGFAWYGAVANEANRDQFAVTVYDDQAGADDSNRRAAEFATTGVGDYTVGDPAISDGTIGVAAVVDGGGPSPAAAATPAASPVADDAYEGSYLAVRLREPNPTWPAAEVARLIGEGYVPLVRAIPGFVAYFGSEDPVQGNLAYVVVFADKTGADESTRVAGGWLETNGYDFFTGDPIVAEGPIGVAAGRLG